MAGSELSYLNSGIYDAWCIDKNVSITRGPTYSTYNAFSCTEAQLGAVSPPLRTGFAYDKLDNINWLVNQGYAGTNAFGTGTIFSFDFQNAIWLLLGQQPASYVPNAKVTELVSRANTLGEGFVASAGQKQGLMLVEWTNSVQPLILVTQASQLYGNTSIPLRFMRELSDKNGLRVKKYLPLQIIRPGEFNLKGLTAGFKYVFKPLRKRKLSYFMQNEGEKVVVNFK